MSKKGMSPEVAESVRIKRGIDKGTKLRRLRVVKGLSQTELSEKSGVPIKTIQVFEQIPNKVDRTKLNTLCDLCLALGCGIGDIIESTELKEKYSRVM